MFLKFGDLANRKVSYRHSKWFGLSKAGRCWSTAWTRFPQVAAPDLFHREVAAVVVAAAEEEVVAVAVVVAAVPEARVAAVVAAAEEVVAEEAAGQARSLVRGRPR